MKMKANREPVSPKRKIYIARLIGRCLIFITCILLFIFRPEYFSILSGGFFRQFSPLHILWGIWIIDMILQLIPVKNSLPLGSQKLFRHCFQPIREKINYQALKNYVISTTKSAYGIFLLWGLLILILGVLYHLHVLTATHLFLTSVLFYVCDLICVLIWCPFRLILKNRCCTTCRIFNWDHLMMFTPMLFINSVFSISLLLLAFAVWVVWELCFMMYPERFWVQSNEALQCANCTDKLCTQYCRKLRS